MLTCCFAALISLCVGMQAGEPVKPPPDVREGDIVTLPRDREMPKRPNTEFRPKVGTPFISLPIPPWISSEDIDLFAMLMQLSDEQKASLNDLHAEYCERSSAVRREVEQKLYDRSAAASAAMQGQPVITGEQQEAVVTVLAEADKVAGLQDAVDEWFMGEALTRIEGIEPWQVERMRLMRRRDVCSVTHIMYSGADCDLTRMQFEMKIELLPDATEAQALQTAQIEYEQMRTKLLEQHRKLSVQQREWSLVRARANEEAFRLREQGEPVPATLNAQVEAHRERLRGPLIHTYRQLRDLNERHVAALQVLAPGAASRSLRITYLEKAYPAAYSDDAHIGHVLEALLAIEDLSDEARESLQSVSDAYAAQQEAMSVEMAEFFVNWFEPFRETLSYGQEFRDKGDEYVRMWTNRVDLAESTLATALEELTPKQRSAVESTVDEWRELVEAVRADGPLNVSPFVNNFPNHRNDLERRRHHARTR